jgi:hypothetical protein
MLLKQRVMLFQMKLRVFFPCNSCSYQWHFWSGMRRCPRA